MANRRLPLRKIKEILRLKHACGLSKREIARSCNVARSTVASCSGYQNSQIAGTWV
jgi:IS30 family transposase